MHLLTSQYQAKQPDNLFSYMLASSAASDSLKNTHDVSEFQLRSKQRMQDTILLTNTGLSQLLQQYSLCLAWLCSSREHEPVPEAAVSDLFI